MPPKVNKLFVCVCVPSSVKHSVPNGTVAFSLIRVANVPREFMSCDKDDKDVLIVKGRTACGSGTSVPLGAGPASRGEVWFKGVKITRPLPCSVCKTQHKLQH